MYEGRHPRKPQGQSDDDMNLMTQQVEELLSGFPIGSQGDESIERQRLLLRFYLPTTRLEWYVSEGSREGDDWLFFGYVRGMSSEWGYFRLSEIRGPFEVAMSVRGQVVPVPVETMRDESFRPCLFRDSGL